MSRSFQIALIAGALVAPPAAAFAQDEARPAPRSRAVERQAAPPRASSGRTVAVPRATPRAEAPRVAPRETPRTAVRVPEAAARAAEQQAAPRRRNPSSSGDQGRVRSQPADRDSGGGGDRAVPRSGTRSGDGDRARSGNDDRARSTPRAAERDRDGRQTYGTAVARRTPVVRPGGNRYYYPRSYYPYYPGSFGYFAWDPFWYGYSPYYGNPYGYGYGYGGGYGGGYGYGYGGAYAGPRYDVYGGVRLKVKPREAEVYVDGYYAGVVDEFDGVFQKLNLDVGPHRIEIRHPGYEPISFELRTQPDETITYEATLDRVP